MFLCWVVKVCGNNGIYGMLEFGSAWEIISVYEVKSEKLLKILTIFVNEKNGSFVMRKGEGEISWWVRDGFSYGEDGFV